ncbi:MAG TPA: aminoglycoside phosphotransferase family protein [Propionicimonas sp.]|uniref:aminoglycoside phosphotransferase family protein n=1 Tax=Propionicimonas sp. TaxID=1955623 RepID=UPI002F3EB5A1
MAEIPAAEVRIDAALVSRLLAEQCPHHADPHVEAFGHGWDNELFALGPDLLVRLPRRQASAGLIDNEIAFLPRLAPRLPVPVPLPVFAGRPGSGYPWRWTVVPRLPGHSAADVPVDGRSEAAVGLAAFLTSLHVPADADAPVNPFRGVPLAARAAGWIPRIRAVAGEAALAHWQRAASVPDWAGPPLWLHGDPHPMNLLLGADGTLTGVLDFGDLCSGDPASDLSVAWLAFDASARARFRVQCDLSGTYDDATWTRAWAWALGLAAVFSQSSDNMPALAAIARHGLTETLGDPEFTRAL